MSGKKSRKVVERDGKFYTARGAELTRASHTLTEAEFFAKILGALRKVTRFWKPAMDCLNDGKRPYVGDNKLQKWEAHCQGCDQWFKLKEIQIDHITPCGGINSYDKIVPWLKKAFVEREGFQRLCLQCHKKKTLEEKKK